MMTRVLLTGATGFLGRYIVPRLRAAGCEVVAVGRRPFDGLTPQATWLRANLLDRDECRRVADAAQAQCLLHLAWYAEHGAFWSAPENFAWSRGTLELLHEFHRSGGRRAVMVGTCAEYDWSYGYLVEDSTPINPRTVYGKCKDATRRLADAYCRANQLEFAWARVFFPYGAGEPMGRLIPSVIRALVLNEPVNCSNGKQYRDFLYAEDAASALVHLVCERPAQGIFNVASGDPIRIADLVMKCVAKLRPGTVPNFGAITVPPDDPPLLVGDNRKLRALGWRPEFSLDEGLEKTVDWIKLRLDRRE